MMNVLADTANMAAPNKKCTCESCARKDKLMALGFSEGSVTGFMGGSPCSKKKNKG